MERRLRDCLVETHYLEGGIRRTAFAYPAAGDHRWLPLPDERFIDQSQNVFKPDHLDQPEYDEGKQEPLIDFVRETILADESNLPSPGAAEMS